MAIYFLHLKTFGRSNGNSAVSAAAYRAGERIHDERTGRTYDHTERQDVMHKEIVLPSEFADDDMEWARDRSRLWNAAEAAETRSNARVAREYLVALPVELSAGERIDLVRGFSRGLADRYGFALDVAIHAPREFPGSDPRNFHAHLLATTRDVTTMGLGAKTTLEMNDSNRRNLGLGPSINELLHVRERWALATNQALEQAHVAARIDHRTLEAQGIDREPLPHIPKGAFEMERHGYRSPLAERLREQYQARVEARQERRASRAAAQSDEWEHTAAGEVRAQSGARVRESASANERARDGSAGMKRQSLEEIRREAREKWLRLRDSRSYGPAREKEAGHGQGAGLGDDTGNAQRQGSGDAHGQGRGSSQGEGTSKVQGRGQGDDLSR